MNILDLAFVYFLLILQKMKCDTHLDKKGCVFNKHCLFLCSNTFRNLFTLTIGQQRMWSARAISMDSAPPCSAPGVLSRYNYIYLFVQTRAGRASFRPGPCFQPMLSAFEFIFEFEFPDFL